MLSFIFILLVAALFTGVVNRTRALAAGRKGPRLFQHLYDAGVRLRKGAVYSTAATAIFKAVPAVYLGAVLIAAMLVPWGGFDALIHFEGDFVMFAYLMALARFSLILGALDTGSSFEGMGASREALYGALVEPAIFFIFGTLALITGRTSFSAIFETISADSPETVIITLLLGYIMLKVVMVEAGRIPVDDSRTHLELTMIHEVMVLDYCGVDLALITIGGWLKTASLAVIAGGVMVSVIGYAGLSALAVAAMVFLMAVVIGLVESFKARNRLNRNPTYIITITSLALLAFVLVYVVSLNIDLG